MMRCFIFSAVFLAVLIVGQINAANKDTILGVDELISKVEDNYNSKSTFEAKFSQLYIDRNFGEIESKGKVYFKRPGKMKWEYSKPTKKIIVSNGKNLWIYDYNDSQAIKDNNFKVDKLPSSISFLWGTRKLRDVFSPKILSVEETKKGKFYTVELTPRQENSNVSKVHFLINSENYFITETSIFDFFGNENRLLFSSQKIGKNISSKIFDFKPPKGVQVIEPPKLTRKKPI